MISASIYMDFWNFSLNLKSVDSNFRPDWHKIAEVFLQEAQAVLNSDEKLRLQDFHIIGSYTQSENDKKLRHWISAYLPKVIGAKVAFLERKKKNSGPRCPQCHAHINDCPFCKASMIGTEEKGIDTQIAVSMLRDAWLKKINVALLVSADRDFIPAVQFLNDMGVRVIHAQFASNGFELSNACWGRFNILQTLEKITRKGATHEP